MFPQLSADQWTFIILALMGITGSAVIPAFNDWRKSRDAKPERAAAVAKTTADTKASEATTAESMANAAGQMMTNYKQALAETQATIDAMKAQSLEVLAENAKQIAAINESYAEQKQARVVQMDDLKDKLLAVKEHEIVLVKVNESLGEQLKTMTEHNIALEQAAAVNRETNAKLSALRDQLNKLQATTEDAANGKPPVN